MITSYADLEPYLKDFQWLEHKKINPLYLLLVQNFKRIFYILQDILLKNVKL